jgi:hypothetical protein
MTEYLLPCSCGQKLAVSARQAGESVRCSCGATLEVPTLRGLDTLERAAAPAAPGRTWGDRQRAVFLLVVAALAAASIAGYLALILPADPTPPPPPEIQSDASLAEAVAAYADLKQGLVPPQSVLSPEALQIVKKRELTIWGIKVLLALAGCGLVAAVVVLVLPRPRRK